MLGRSGILYIFLVAAAFGSHARAEQMTSGAWQLATFEISFIEALQGSGNTASGMLAWTPRYAIDGRYAVRANLGAAPLRGNGAHGNNITFAAIDAEVLGRMMVSERFDVEAGGGIQDWDNQGGVAGAASVNIGYEPAPWWLGFIDRAFVGYTNVFHKTNVSELRAGLAYTF